MNYTVYKHISPSGKIYVGITKQKPEYRWNNGKIIEKTKYYFTGQFKNMDGITLLILYYILG